MDDDDDDDDDCGDNVIMQSNMYCSEDEYMVIVMMLYVRSFHTLIQLFSTKKKVYFQYHCQQQQFQKHTVSMLLTFLYTGQTMLLTFKY